MSVPNLIPYKSLYISDYICSCYAFVFIFDFLKLISKHILQFHSSFIAAQYFPDKQLDKALRDRFDYLFGLLHDQQKMEPKYHASRIQNTSGTIGLLVDKYQAYGDIADLQKASRLADWLMNNWQREDGAYVNHHIILLLSAKTF